MRLILCLGFGVALAWVRPVVAAQPAAVAIVPSRLEFSAGPGMPRRLLLLEMDGGVARRDLSNAAKWSSSNHAVARVAADGTVTPVGPGSARVTARNATRTSVAQVTVRGPLGGDWGFTRHVLPMLTRAGCNSGACHGASAGKGGLKLSLRGYDAAFDHASLTRQIRARRVDTTNPDASLALRKATLAMPHGGGRRILPGSLEHRVLRGWIAAGAPGVGNPGPGLREIEIFPKQSQMRPGSRQQILVQALYADGSREDVTRWCKFTSAEDAVASVEDEGRLTVRGPGETAISVWFNSRVGFTRVTVPHPDVVPESAYSAAARRNYIDDHVLAKLRALHIRPAGLCSDEEFIRRAFLDAAGILPPDHEVATFMADPPADRRQRLVDRLLRRPEFVDYWAYRWSDLLLVSSRRLPARGVWSFYDWIRSAVDRNVPWDEMVRQIITASGSTLVNGAANYFVIHKDPIDLTETTTQAFLGMSLTCARCHNHPMEKWTQNDYFGMANLFARVRLKAGDSVGETVVLAVEDGDVNHPRAGVPLPPRPLDGVPLALDDPADRREALARWVTSPANPYFTRAVVNRIARNYLGRGLIEAEDDLRLTNPPSNESLFQAMCSDLVRGGYDLRGLMRTIMLSATYQRSSVGPAVGDERYYAAYIPRRLGAEVLLDAISHVTGTPTEFAGFPRGTRATQLPDVTLTSYFLTAFGRPQRVQTCSCERTEESSVAQVLHLVNGETINDRLRAPNSFAAVLAASTDPPEALLESLFRRVYGRSPSPPERAALGALVRDAPPSGAGRRELFEDILAAMLTTREFLFNH